MDISLDNILFSFIEGAAAFQSLILAFVLILRPGPIRLPNYLLAVLNLLFAIVLLYNSYCLMEMAQRMPFFILWPITFWLLIPSILYLYARSRLQPKPRLHLSDLLHTLPFFMIWFIWKDVIFAPGGELGKLFEKYPSELFGTHVSDLVTYIFPVQGIIYLGLSLFLFGQYRKQHLNKLTDYSQHQIIYLIRLYQLLLGKVTILMALTYFPAFGNLWPGYLDDFIGIFVPIIVYFISYLALFNPGGLFEKIELAKPVFKSRQLPRDQSKRYAAKLEKIMHNEAPYLEPELNQEELARALGVQPRQLSRLLKQQFNCTFTEYINAYRVEKVKALMEDPKHRHWSLMAIAFEAGFNSKSTFNRIFKKQMGLTPREYSQQQPD